eukprot:scaffold1248_cov170-Amphora_coffeaeformis.AAC.15
MIGKNVQVFWPVDDQWYTGKVYEYDPTSGEHLLRYEDGDAEWVRIGESEDQQSQPPSQPQLPPSSHHPYHPEGAQAPDTPGLETPQTTPERAPDGLPPPRLGGMAYYHMAYNPAGGPPGNVPGVVYAMYPPPPPPPPSHGQPHHQHPHHPSDYAHGHAPSSGPRGGEDPYERGESPSKRKMGPKAWTKEEDSTLLRIVQTMQMPMKWSVVALSLPGRTGKQCRERYVNHLNPRLKVSDWNPVEDTTIFHLYSSTGSHWSSMSKVIPGRTDNGIKNRFHNLRRQVEREDETRQKKTTTAADFPEDVRMDLMRDFPEDLQGKFDSLWEKEHGMGLLAADTVQSSENDTKSYFGPFVEARDGDICVRCGFIMPSVQTGRQVCEKTGWCLACALLPPQLSGNLLRECLSLRREKNAEYREKIESWDIPKRVEQRQDA